MRPGSPCPRWPTWLALVVLACGPPAPTWRVEDFLRVGVDPVTEADRVEANLVEGGWTLRRRVEGEGVVALSFERGTDGRAVRVVTRRGVAAALDSHEPNGVLRRHGAVRLADEPIQDVTADGRPELLVAREEPGGSVCLAILALEDDGSVRTVPNEAEALHAGACPHRFLDVDGVDGPEALVEVVFPGLSLDPPPPRIEVPLTYDGETFRATGAAVSYLEAEQARRAAALVTAHAEHDAATAVRLAVEVAALSQLGGAAPSAQAIRFDRALEGVELSAEQSERVAAIRRVIHDGWPAPPE